MKLFEQGAGVLLCQRGVRLLAVIQKQAFCRPVLFGSFLKGIRRKDGDGRFVLGVGTVKMLADQGRGKQGEGDADDDDGKEAEHAVSFHEKSP